jgi:hypothetical protein
VLAVTVSLSSLTSCSLHDVPQRAVGGFEIRSGNDTVSRREVKCDAKPTHVHLGFLP